MVFIFFQPENPWSLDRGMNGVTFTYDIGTLVVGYNETFQRKVHIGKQNNQNFVNIPYGRLQNKLQYLCDLNGIKFVKKEEEGGEQ